MPLQFCDHAPTKIVAATVVCAATSPRGLTGGAADKIPPLNVVEIRDPNGEIVSYRHLVGPTEVTMRGTRLAPNAQVKIKVGSRPGFVELDINRGAITGLRRAHTIGKDFLTYVLWAVSVDGRASNLGEITFEGDRPVSINVTTPYQTFWLMVTAEPNYAVVDPSPQVVLYSVKQSLTAENRAVSISTQLFFFTHYASYSGEVGAGSSGVPNHLLQARKAVELATKAAAATKDRTGRKDLREEEFTTRTLSEASSFLARAEQSYAKNPGGQDVTQFARTAAQSAENARALAMGAVGGLVIRQLQDEVDRLRQELQRVGQPAGSGKGADPLSLMPNNPPVATVAPIPVIDVPLAKQPAIWFAVAGWLLAIVVLFRRRPA